MRPRTLGKVLLALDAAAAIVAAGAVAFGTCMTGDLFERQGAVQRAASGGWASPSWPSASRTTWRATPGP